MLSKNHKEIGAVVREVVVMGKLEKGEQVDPGEVNDVVLATLRWFGNLPAFDSALCAETDPELFFPDHKGAHTAAVAKSICRSCDLITACRDFALDHRIEWGVWGGTTPKERQLLRKLMDDGTF
jgi:hypothetical protein